MFCDIKKTITPCATVLHDDEIPVTPNLAYKLSDAVALSEQGIPVNSLNVELFQHGEPNPSWELSSDLMRGADPADLWEQSVDVKSRLKHSRKLPLDNQQ